MAILGKVQDRARESLETLKNQPIQEGRFTKKVEQQTAKIPSIGYLGLAIGSMVFSGILVRVAERKELANFVGLWAPTFLLIGVYNKLVKLEEGFSKQSSQGQKVVA